MTIKTRLSFVGGSLLLALLPGALSGCSAEAGEEATVGADRATLCTAVTLSTSTPSPKTIGTQVTLTATPTCDSGGVQFEFAVRASTTTSWTIIQPFGAASSALWNTNALASASYVLRVRARNAGTTPVVATTNYVLGTASPCAGAVLVANQAYATDSTNLVDLHLPTGFSGSRPVIVWIHGGGWHSNSKTLESGARDRLCPLVAQGYAVASVDYGLTCIPSTCPGGDPPSCEDHIFPQQIQDVKAAVRFLRARAASFQLTANRFVAWGASAGGHLSALLGTSSGVAELEDPSQGNPTVPSKVQGFIDCYGPTRLELMDAELGKTYHHSAPCSAESQLLGCDEGLEAASCPASQLNGVSPLTHVNVGDPPALISHGTADPAVPFQQSEHLKDALQAAGVPVTFQLVEGGTHNLDSCPSAANVQAFLAGLFP